MPPEEYYKDIKTDGTVFLSWIFYRKDDPPKKILIGLYNKYVVKAWLYFRDTELPHYL